MDATHRPSELGSAESRPSLIRVDSGPSRSPTRVRPAVLALQGSVEPHVRKFSALGHDAVEVRLPEHLDGVSHLVLPGGESTTCAKLLEFYRLWDLIRDRATAGDLALFGTCAGAILLGRETDEPPPRLGLLDIKVDRNAYGRQIDSFVSQLDSAILGDLQGVFIRAPRIKDVGERVEVLATHGVDPVLVVEQRVMAGTFHPELTGSASVHDYFLKI